MALIGTLRNKMTKWVVGFVAVAIASFVLNDLFGNGPRSVFGSSENIVGKIAGHDVTLEEFQSAVQDRESSYVLNFGRSPGEQERPALRQQAWNLLISRYAITPQYEAVGVKVTGDEEWDIIQGRNINENIKLSFTDSAGNFDRNSLISYIQSLDAQPINSEPRIRWNIFRAELVPSRERIKFENLILKTNYVTEAESEKEYHLQNDVAEIKYLYVPFYAISDSLVDVTDALLKAYYNKNKEKYKAEITRDVSYVSFPIIPSASDSAAIREEMEAIASDFRITKEDSVFVSINSDGSAVFTNYTIASIPQAVSDKINSMSPGSVEGPFLEGNQYKVIKLISTSSDTTYNAKASHILIRWEDTTDAAKRASGKKAQKILNDIKAGKSFAAQAREFGTDGTASRGGDLGWFTSGQMVKPFQDAVFNATRKGLINHLVETEFGYHIIDVTELKDNTSYTVATIERDITPGDDTQNEAYRKADLFASTLSGLEDFKNTAKEDSLTIYNAEGVKTTATGMNNISKARQVVLWLFKDAKVGKVSEVYDVSDSYIVAVMTGETEEGYISFKDAKEEIVPPVKNKVKGKMIIEKLNSLSGSLDEMAAFYGSDATVHSSSDLKLNSNSLPGIGVDPIGVGKAFTLNATERSVPFLGENGVLLIEMVNKTIAPEVGDYSIFKNQLLQTLNGQAGLNITEALKKGANIKDTRYLFY